MFSMRYDLDQLPLNTLLLPLARASAALARLDERLALSPVGAGLIERLHFADACASLWLDGELVEMEDLVLHEAARDIRSPSHALTIARDVLQTRRRIAAQAPDWALSPNGLRSLRVGGQAWRASSSGGDGTIAESESAVVPDTAVGWSDRNGEGRKNRLDDGLDLPGVDLDAIDAVLARSETVLARAKEPECLPRREADPLIRDPDWDEEERLDEWRTVLRSISDFPPVLQAILALDAWNELAVLQRAPWLGRLLAASLLRRDGLTTKAHLLAFNVGLKTIRVERRSHRNFETRLMASLEGLIAGVEFGFKAHDRLLLARRMLERRLAGRRASSKLPGLIELVLARPLVSAGMIAAELDITPRAALRLVEELNLREMTGRGRFRAWGIV
ncbi:RHE_PE00001 family protein [Brucella intermedia GD04153]|uniref:RHE_PE00001 family protein n=1 Tax=Brucella intermedia GD04153 TaxID=2975438 RepID=A0AA42H741_9HYPH|nr:RHE_PE00001 family protein [Brucella intermedia]MDH0126778.1 RHE_PE00001 family protein [Brucella intermedia GD04153]